MAYSLEEMEEYLRNLYKTAGEELVQKAAQYMLDFQRLEEQHKRDVQSGKWTQEQFDTWRKNKLLYGTHWTRMIQTVQRDMAKVNQTALDYINGKIPQIFAQTYNEVAEKVPKSPVSGYSFELVNADTVKNLIDEEGIILPPKKNLDKQKDKLWNAKQVNAQLLQGILQGESIKKIAARMQNVANADLVGATRTARTMCTAAENSGRQSAYNRAAKDGIKFTKTWLAALQGNTRDTHKYLNQQTQPHNKPFESSSGAVLMFPGDWHAPPAEVYNCRCTMITNFKGFDKVKLEKAAERQKQLEQQQISIREIPQRPERPKSSNYSNDSEYEQAREKYRTERDKCKAILDSYLQEDLNRTRKYKTKEDVIEWCQANNVRIDSNVLNIIDIRVFDDVISVHEEMFKRFPKVKEFQDKFYPYGFSYDDTESKEYLFSANRGLYFGESWKDYEWALRNSVLDRMSTGYLTNGDGTLKTVLRHEFGHNVEHLVKEQFSTYELRGDDPQVKVRTEERKKYESELFELTTKYCKTEYAFTNTAEAFAEGFAEFTSNPNTEYGKAFARFFERWYKE